MGEGVESTPEIVSDGTQHVHPSTRSRRSSWSPRRWFLALFASAIVVTGVGHSSAGSTATSTLPPPLGSSTKPAIYVSITGSDRNPGTLARPLRTIQRALDRVRPGGRVLVRKGLYEEGLQFERSGTRNAPITLAAYRRERPVVRPPAREGDDTYTVEIRASYVRVKGLVLEGATGMSSANVYVNDGAANVEIRGNVIRRGQDQGIFTDDSTSNVQMIGNRVYSHGAGMEGQHQSHGLYIQGTRHLIANNVIHDHPFGFGIHLYPENDGTIVVANTVAYGALGGIVIGGGDVRDITIRNNIFAFNGRYGISVDSEEPEDSRADANLVYGNGWAEIEPEIEGTDTSGGNIVSAPHFVSPRERDFRLTRVSPSIDRAVRQFSLPVDVEGVVRPQGRAPDIGAYEWAPKRSTS